MNEEETRRLAEEFRVIQQRNREEEAALLEEEAAAAAQRMAEAEALRGVGEEARVAAEERAAAQQDPNIMLAMQGRGLTDGQFNVFLQTINDRSQADREHDQQRRNQQRVHQLVKDEIKSQTKRIRPCDGANAAAVREYLTEIELARPYVGHDDVAVNKIVANTAQGGLKKSYERFMSAQANRDNVAWAAVRNHLRAAFLSQDEQEHLRTALERVKQTQYEGNTAYTRRFLESADDAYPPGERTAGDERVLLNNYVRGLKEAKVVERLVQETRPNTLEEAILGVEQFTADLERFQRFGWAPESGEPESMEVNAIQRVSHPPGIKGTGLGIEDFIKSLGIPALTQQLKGVQAELGKIKSLIGTAPNPSKSYHKPQSNNKPFPGPSTSQPSPQKPRKRGPCYVCGKGGHWARDCFHKKGSPPNNADPKMNQGN